MINIQDLYYLNVFKQEKKKKSKTVKHLIRELKEKKYNPIIHYSILRYDAYSFSKFNFKNKLDFFDNEKVDKLKYLLTNIFFSNFAEKYIIYTDSENKDDVTFQDMRDYHDMIVNSKGVEEKKNILANIFFKISHEQMIFQERYFEQYFFRMICIFEDCEISKGKVKEITSLDFEKLIVLIWFLYTHIVAQDKVISIIDREVFKDSNYGENITNISYKEIDIFLDFISVSKDEFKEKYFFFRKGNNDKILSYEKLEYIDQYLPKPSYYYPFIKTEDKNLQLISYTALNQFIHLERVFSLIADSDIDYRTRILGDLLEKYIYKLFLNFQSVQGDDVIKVHYYEEQEYYPTKRITRHYPDIIVEGQEYIIFIESKSSALKLKQAIQNFEKEAFTSTVKAINKSKTNINEFLKYNPLGLQNIETKKIYKFVCFNVISSSMLSALLSADFIDAEDLVMTDLSSLELFSHPSDKIDIINFLDNFIDGLNQPLKTSSLQHYCIDCLDVDVEKFQKKHFEIVNKYLKK